MNKMTGRAVEALLAWNRSENNREMPWKGVQDPYKIWLSEVLLQQTRVDQGWSYYLAFTERFPTVVDLAQASDDEVFKMWEGLGYYARCRNLLHTARYIANDLNGVFPDSYDGLVRLKGVGPYTAAAIASFAYNEHQAVLDGNVFRVLARFHGMATPIDSSEGKKLFAQLAQAWLPKNNAREWNQTIMDFGATVCTPKNPACLNCVLSAWCVGFQTNQAAALPKKGKKILRRQREFIFHAVFDPTRTWVRKRSDRDIWPGLYEPITEEDFQLWQHHLPSSSLQPHQKFGPVKHLLTHQELTIQVHVHRLVAVLPDGAKTFLQDKNYQEISHQQWGEIAFPVVLKRWISRKEFFPFP